jgi:hypothetical protein
MDCALDEQSAARSGWDSGVGKLLDRSKAAEVFCMECIIGYNIIQQYNII